MLCISTALPVHLLFFSMFNKVKQQFNPAAGQRSAVIKAVPLSLAPWAHSPDWNNHGLVLSPLKLVLAVIHLMNMQQQLDVPEQTSFKRQDNLLT